MRIYRVEHFDTKIDPNLIYHMGPYYTFKLFESWCSDNHNQRNVVPELDPILKKEITSDWHLAFVCGFHTLTQFNSWFSKEERERLKELGYVLAEYHSIVTIKGKYQTLFVPHQSRSSVRPLI